MRNCAIKGSNWLLCLEQHVGKGQNAGVGSDAKTSLTSMGSTHCLPRLSMQDAAVAAQAAEE